MSNDAKIKSTFNTDFAAELYAPVWPWYKRTWYSFTYWLEFRAMPVVYLAIAFYMLFFVINALHAIYSQ